jgi:hypothetical protein
VLLDENKIKRFYRKMGEWEGVGGLHEVVVEAGGGHLLQI